jgi:hypothetical protein
MGGGSAEEIVIMLDEHYNGLINIADYWDIGDTRTESITEIPSGTTGETQSAQDIDLLIIGLNHDDLETGINGVTKSAVTIQTLNSLTTAGYMYTDSSLKNSLWSTSPRRTWCNNEFFNALPDTLSSSIKPISKKTNRYGYAGFGEEGCKSYRQQETTIDKVFLLSLAEVFGDSQSNDWKFYYGSLDIDGVNYEYMKTSSNRIKTVNGEASNWYTRTSIVSGQTSAFISTFHNNTSGTWQTITAPGATGIAPAFCL